VSSENAGNNIPSPPPGSDMIDFKKFFTFIGFRDKFLLVVGLIGALVAGFLMPCISIAMGSITNTFNPLNAKE